jgi:hypothetical protein
MEFVGWDWQDPANRPCHCMIRLPNLQKAVEAILISGIAFFLLEHIMGFDKVLYKWFVFCSTASCVGAVAGMVRTVLVGRILLLRHTHYLKVGKVVILPKFASMPVKLDFCLAIPSVAISLVIWMSITGWVGMIISFILLMCHALNITDIFAPYVAHRLRAIGPVTLVCSRCKATIFASKDTLPPCSFQRNAEPADAREALSKCKARPALGHARGRRKTLSTDL